MICFSLTKCTQHCTSKTKLSRKVGGYLWKEKMAKFSVLDVGGYLLRPWDYFEFLGVKMKYFCLSVCLAYFTPLGRKASSPFLHLTLSCAVCCHWMPLYVLSSFLHLLFCRPIFLVQFLGVQLVVLHAHLLPYLLLLGDLPTSTSLIMKYCVSFQRLLCRFVSFLLIETFFK